MNAMLNLHPNFSHPGRERLHAYDAGDDFYEMLIELHRDLDDANSQLVNARLILLLSNHIGDLDVLREAMAAARRGVEASPKAPSASV